MRVTSCVPSRVSRRDTGLLTAEGVAIAVYASMSKELGLPSRFPGKPGAYDTLLEMTDAGLLARATVWAATEPRATHQALNIDNGDRFRWHDMWPKIAHYVELDVVPPLPMSLDTIMADKESLWKETATRHGLQSVPYPDASSWRFADFVSPETTICSATAQKRGVSVFMNLPIPG